MGRFVSIGSSRARSLAAVFAAGLVSLAAAALYVAGPGGAAPGGRVVGVSERDFRISAPARVRAGEVVLRVQNRSPDDHELIVVRSTGMRLPLRSDGLTVSEEALQHAEVGALEPGSPGAVRELRLTLTPGRYVLFCNMEGHYLGGMHTVLVVR
jgi:uncharacterized cupredoxin-like copper-binding protein